MFARIAGSYDLLNRTLSLGIDQRWRKRALRQAGDVRGRTVVDVCCGTGDLSALFARAGARVVGLDFTREMLMRSPRKLKDGYGPALFSHADALRLPLADDVADVASVAFGIRNVADRARGIAELARVVKPGGQVLVLEFTTPRRGPFGAVYRTYFTRVLPRVGRLVSKDSGAYEYLPRTVLAWPDPEAFQAEMEAAGLIDCGFERLTQGIACLHWGRVPGATA
ncbi:MAG: ubiquinone/menaquinone biosynthesis methyltransferase [bacterium]|nr:ubiquinone/menaquinone biosynthesis methyltransferase [bacterium]